MRKGKTRNATDRREQLIICCVLVCITLIVFWRVMSYGYICLDDGWFVRDNPSVQTGLTAQSMKWAFTTSWQGLWQPMTWLSYMLDRQLSATGTSVFHATNLLLHVCSTLLLYALLSGLTRCKRRSAFVAALFAIHPAHVESVAWIAERKDVLSTFFCMVTLLAYLRYVRKRTIGSYVLVAVSLALGLMSKAMLVTLPIVLLILDYWPLGRVGPSTDPKQGKTTWLRLLREKIPLVLMVVVVSGVTLVTMRADQSIGTGTKFSLSESISIAVFNYTRYIWTMLYPAHLSIVYSDPVHALPLWMVSLSAATTLGITLLTLRLARRHPYLAFGWLWYVVTLLPVSGLIQQGILTRADHFTYIPYVGLFVIIAWGVPSLLAGIRTPNLARQWLAPAALALVLVLATLSYIQVGYWRDSKTLFTHAIRVTEHNSVATGCLGIDAEERGDIAEAERFYRKAIRVDPKLEHAHYLLGTILSNRGDLDGAIRELSIAVKLSPRYFMAHGNLGAALARKGRLDEAIKEFEAALKIQPGNEMVTRNLEIARAEKAARAVTRQ